MIIMVTSKYGARKNHIPSGHDEDMFLVQALEKTPIKVMSIIVYHFDVDKVWCPLRLWREVPYLS